MSCVSAVTVDSSYVAAEFRALFAVCSQIELQQEQEAMEIGELWNELRQKLMSLFDNAAAPPPSFASSFPTSSDSGATGSMHHMTVDSIRELIERFLCCSINNK